MMSREPEVTPEQHGRRKPYLAPALVVYGDLRRLTAGGGGIMNDGGGMGSPNTKA